jgi:hypothetical protein
MWTIQLSLGTLAGGGADYRVLGMASLPVAPCDALPHSRLLTNFGLIV